MNTMNLQGKKILLGITGSIAAYKSAFLVRLLVKAGAEVKVVMSTEATHFITPLTLATLSKNPVVTDLADHEGNWANHVHLGRWAHLMVIAPASCNTIAKMAAGICDNLLMAVYLSATCPVMISPAMDEDMWKHPTTKRNLDLLSRDGVKTLQVHHGELASGLIGEGRMEEPEHIITAIQDFLGSANKLAGKNVLITAGPTREPIDPVRYISNHSTGKMGIALAKECLSQGAQVTLVLGPTSEVPPANCNVVKVNSAEEMYQAVIKDFGEADIAIMSAAVADFTSVEVADKKIKKGSSETVEIQLKRTKDILKECGQLKQPHQTLVGFALETNDEEANALQKLKSKNADFIVLNSTQDKGAGFGTDTNKITIFEKSGVKYVFDLKSKTEVAKDIINIICP